MCNFSTYINDLINDVIYIKNKELLDVELDVFILIVGVGQGILIMPLLDIFL
jgi:hypothetical protein